MEAGGLYRLASIDTQPDDDSPSPSVRLGGVDEEIDAVDDCVLVEHLLEALPAREQKIVYLRFYEGLTQSEIAEEVGISQMHVSRLLVKSLDILASRAEVLHGTNERP